MITRQELLLSFHDDPGSRVDWAQPPWAVPFLPPFLSLSRQQDHSSSVSSPPPPPTSLEERIPRRLLRTCTLHLPNRSEAALDPLPTPQRISVSGNGIEMKSLWGIGVGFPHPSHEGSPVIDPALSPPPSPPSSSLSRHVPRVVEQDVYGKATSLSLDGRER